MECVLTLTFLFTGERRFEHAVHEAALLQQTNGHAKIPEEGKSAEIREVNTARRELSRISAVKVLSAKAGMQRRVATSAPISPARY
jgi:hypothetical protein